MMKKIYIVLLTISLVGLGADCDDFMLFMAEHLIMLALFVFSAIKLMELEDKKEAE